MEGHSNLSLIKEPFQSQRYALIVIESPFLSYFNYFSVNNCHRFNFIIITQYFGCRIENS